MSESSDLDDLFSLTQGTQSPPAPSKTAPAKGVDARKEARVAVKWDARVLLHDGTVVPLWTRDVSESGLGLVSERPISAHSTLRVALAVPDLNVPGRFTTVTGSLKTAHVTISGPDLIYGGTWLNIDDGGRDVIQKWVRKLR